MESLNGDVEIMRKGPVALYYQIAEILEKEFLQSYEPGSQVPPEPELIGRFQVSRSTVRRAMDLLEDNGILLRQPGRGTFLTTAPKIEVELSELTGFVEDMDSLGLKASAQVVQVKPVRPGPTVTARLHLPDDAEVVFIERVRLAQDEPLSFDATYLPMDPGMLVAQDNLTVYPIFSLLETKYGIRLGEADYVVEASTAPKRIAEYLHLAPGAPILLIERTTYSDEGTPIDYEKLYYRADKIRYRMTLKRHSPSIHWSEHQIKGHSVDSDSNSR